MDRNLQFLQWVNWVGFLQLKEPTVPTDTPKNLDESPGNSAEWKQPISKGYCVSPFVKHPWNDKNYRNGKQMSGCQGLETRGGGWRKVDTVTEDACDDETVWCFDCGGGYVKPRMWWNCTELGTHTRRGTSEMEETWTRCIDCQMSISWYCMIVLHMGKGHVGSVYYFLQLHVISDWKV